MKTPPKTLLYLGFFSFNSFLKEEMSRVN